MCTRYETPEEDQIRHHWQVGHEHSGRDWDRIVFPRGRGVFIRRAANAGQSGRELVVGQWALIPVFATSPVLRYSTCNARSEELSRKASYREPWARGQRCIIPATSFDEPCWETGRNVWWRFRRPDGAPWGLAGLWNAWVDRQSGEVHESYTMLTINADHHPLMRRMHKPVPGRAPDAQDKRSVIPLEPASWDQWLNGSVADGAALLRLSDLQVFDAAPVQMTV